MCACGFHFYDHLPLGLKKEEEEELQNSPFNLPKTAPFTSEFEILKPPSPCNNSEATEKAPRRKWFYLI